MERIKKALEEIGIKCAIEGHSAAVVIPGKKTEWNTVAGFDHDGTPRGFVMALSEYAENYDPSKEADYRVAMHYMTSREILYGVDRIVDDARQAKDTMKTAARKAMAAVMEEELETAINGRTFFIDIADRFSSNDNRFYEMRPLPKNVKVHSWEEYGAGDIVYTNQGTKFRILYTGESGRNVYMEYMEGPRAGLLTYIGNTYSLYK